MLLISRKEIWHLSNLSTKLIYQPDFLLINHLAAIQSVSWPINQNANKSAGHFVLQSINHLKWKHPSVVLVKGDWN